MLRKIKDIISPKKPTGNPYNLNDSEFAKLMELREHPYWETYTSFLDTLATFLTEDMLSSSTPEAVMFYRSYIIGIRRAGTIIDELIAQEKAKDARERDRFDRAKRDAESKRLATYGTPFWDT